MKKIPLTRGKYALVDDEDFDWLNQWKWFADKIGGSFYSSRSGYSKELKKQTKLIRMHRFILNAKPGQLVDHADGNTLNNQRNNLRFATKSDNSKNSKVNRKNNSSGYKGIERNRKKWQARLTINSKRISLGTYKNKKLAAIAYNKAAKKYYGKFAKLNKIR